MSLFVDVSIAADSIVKAAWARATANRERLRRRLDVQAVREEVVRSTINGRSSGIGWELQYTTPTPLQYRPDEPVAYPARRDATPAKIVAPGRWFVSISEVDSKIALWSGNGLERIEFPFDGSIFPVALPIGGESMIVFTGPTTGGRKCVFINRTTIKEVPTPAAIEPYPFIDTYSLTFGSLSTGHDDERVDPAFSYTPSVFLNFPELYPDLHPIPAGFDPSRYELMRPLIDDIVTGIRITVVLSNHFDNPGLGEFTHSIESTGYEWTGSDPVDSDLTPLITTPLSSSPWRSVTVQAPPDAVIPLSINAAEAAAGIQAAVGYCWDWGLPSLCRSQLLAVGFRPEDLEP